MAVESSDAGSEWMGEADSLMRDMEIMIAERVPEDHAEDVRPEDHAEDVQKRPMIAERVPEDHAEDVRQEHLALDEMPLFAMLEGETM